MSFHVSASREVLVKVASLQQPAGLFVRSSLVVAKYCRDKRYLYELHNLIANNAITKIRARKPLQISFYIAPSVLSGGG